MKILRILVLTLILLVSLAAGFAKLLEVPEEAAFFRGLGLNVLIMQIFGAVQIFGGVLLGFAKTRFWGALLTTVMFCLSSIMIFLAGQIPFAFFSLLPVVLSGLILWHVFSSPQASAPVSPAKVPPT